MPLRSLVFDRFRGEGIDKVPEPDLDGDEMLCAMLAGTCLYSVSGPGGCDSVPKRLDACSAMVSTVQIREMMRECPSPGWAAQYVLE